MRFSLIALWGTCIGITLITFFYYPKWNKVNTEATISWDVSGYYWYLPATFIYHDLKNLAFNTEILNKYHPTYEVQQSFAHPSGTQVMKYSCGQSVMMLPAFLLAHTFAPILGYAPDGFSLPYQFAIFLWGLLISLLGLILLRQILTHYFSETAAGLTLLFIVFGSNYLEYGAITNAMTHNYLFTLYVVLLWASIHFQKKPSYPMAFLIGCIVGLMALIRPTEILAAFIPIIYALQIAQGSLKAKFMALIKLYPKLILASLTVFAIGSLQLIYWKYVTGEWVVYSYEDQGFSWTRPHIVDGLISGRAGWLIYSPIMIFSLVGFYGFIKKYKLFAVGLTIFSFIFIYITFAWDIWWYGGSVGQRALVQIYPILAFPMASLIDRLSQVNFKSIALSLLALVMIHYNIWVVHQAHYGGMLVAGEMTSEYLKAILFRNSLPDGAKKLLDTRKIYYKEIENATILLDETDTINAIPNLCLGDTLQYSPSKKFKLPANEGWLRASADFYTENKEWNTWQMTQLIVKYYKSGVETRSDVLRAQRHLDNGQKVHLYLDSKLRYKPDEVEIFLWNSDSPNAICIENLRLLYHEGK